MRERSCERESEKRLSFYSCLELGEWGSGDQQRPPSNLEQTFHRVKVHTNQEKKFLPRITAATGHMQGYSVACIWPLSRGIHLILYVY